MVDRALETISVLTALADGARIDKSVSSDYFVVKCNIRVMVRFSLVFIFILNLCDRRCWTCSIRARDRKRRRPSGGRCSIRP